MWRATTIIVVTAGLVGTANSVPPPPGWEHTPAKSIAYKDPRSSITFYVESDGRHVAAIDSGGNLLWVRIPHQESRTGSPGVETSVIDGIDQEPATTGYAQYLQQYGFRPEDKLLKITFTSYFFGELDERTGAFVLIGRN
jgi:hypothetical protein